MIRELNQARSKSNIVDRPAKTAHTFVHHYNSTQCYSTIVGKGYQAGLAKYYV